MSSVPQLWRKLRLQNISFKGGALFWNVFFLFFVGSSAQEEILCTKPTDLGILLDSSDATVTNWQEVLDFANALVQFFNVSPTGSNVGVITYSTEANLAMDFNSFQGNNLSSDSVRDVINDLKPTRGGRKIDEALKLANERLFVRDAGMRDDEDILKIIVVLTTGKQTTENGSFIPLNQALELLRGKRVEIFVVGVGSKENIDISELIQISRKQENVLTSEKFENLVILAEDLAKVVCGMKVTEVGQIETIVQGDCNALRENARAFHSLDSCLYERVLFRVKVSICYEKKKTWRQIGKKFESTTGCQCITRGVRDLKSRIIQKANFDRNQSRWCTLN